MDIADTQRTFSRELISLTDDSTLWTNDHLEQETPECNLTQPGWFIARCPTHLYHTRLLTSLQRLRERYPDPELLSILAANTYFRITPNPSPETEKQLHLAHKVLLESLRLLLYGMFGSENLKTLVNLQQTQGASTYRGHRLLRILNACLVETMPPSDLIERIKIFLEPLRTPDKDREVGRNLSRLRIQDCLNLLIGLPSSPALMNLLSELSPVHPWASGNEWSYQVYDAWSFLPGLLRTLFTHDMLPYEAFQHVAFLIPYRSMKAEWIAEESQAFRQQIEAFQEQVTAEVAQNLSQNNYKVILTCDRPLHKAGWLLAAAQAHSRLQIGRLVGTGGRYSPETIEQAIIRLARAEAVEPSEEDARMELVARLQQFPVTTLKALFAVAIHSRRVLCMALGWDNALPLIELVEHLASHTFPTSYSYGTSETADMPNSIDTFSGLLDVLAVQSVLSRVDQDLANEVLALLSSGKAGVENAATLVRAVMGGNRTSILQGLKHNGQISIKAYGLLPLTRGEDEILERYLELQRQARLGKNFGPSRRLSHSAAVQVALANLAQVAGFRNAAHLEWEMEARIVQQATQTRQAWTVGTYELQVVLEGAGAAICVTRDNRTLKSIPKEVRASSVYQEAKEALGQVRTHISRLRKGLLERLLEAGEPLSLEELSLLVAMPTARTLLSLLVWIADDGTMGLLETDSLALRDLDQNLHPVVTPIILAHPYHLFQAGTLTSWQQEIIHRRIVQPIKQVFRELYVLTSAEQQTATYSLRFADHHIKGNVAAGLCASRGWQMHGSYIDNTAISKRFPGMRAIFELSPSGDYLGEPGANAITGNIYFEHSTTSLSQIERIEQQHIIPLREIPPLIFSEVMRDADLLVSVAQTEQHDFFSVERYTRTGEVVKTLLEELQLQGVTIAGHFAYIQGKLARYRVHLGSAAIHIEPGNYLCIVPNNWGQTHEKLFLPFAEDEGKTSEVISKVLLLLADDRIKDESILSQIRNPR